MMNCYIKSEWTVNRPSLKSLKMDCCHFRENNCYKRIENIVSGCPLLEWLELFGYIDDDFAIVSISLKVLSFVEADTPDVIKITCPSLVEFNMNDSMFPDQMIESVLSSSPLIHSLKLVNCRGSEWEDELVIASNSLKVLHLECANNTQITISCPNLVKLDMLCDGDIVREVVNLPSTVCATLDYARYSDYEPMDYKLLEQFQHVSTLTIQRLIVEFISDLDVEERSSLPLLKSKCLTLNIGASFGLALPGIVHALRSPMLETLIITLDSKYKSQDYQDLISARLDYWDSNKSTSFTCLVSHLKTVEIIGLYETDNKCKFELEFIEFLLKNAQVLKKMTVSLQKSREAFVIEFAQKLVRFPRYSRCANVELLCST